jgi:hypothetical protein
VPASAILVINDCFVSGRVCEFNYGARRQPTKAPIACVEILGQSALERTVTRFQRAGVQAISIIAGSHPNPSLKARNLEIAFAGLSRDRWLKAAHKMKEHAAWGVDEVIVMGLGAYVEFDLAEALQSHRARRSFLTQLQHDQQPLDFWIVDAAAIRMQACDCTLPFSMDRTNGPSVQYPVRGYANRLADAYDLRQLAADAFLARCTIRPRGNEVKPGIWMDDGAKAHRSARIVAPAYLGKRDFRAALRALDRAQQLGPKVNPPVHLAKAQAWLGRESYGEAAVELENYLGGAPKGQDSEHACAALDKVRAYMASNGK